MSDWGAILAFLGCLAFGVVGFIAGYSDGRHDERVAHDATYLPHPHANTYGLDTWGCLASLIAVILAACILIFSLLHRTA